MINVGYLPLAADAPWSVPTYFNQPPVKNNLCVTLRLGVSFLSHYHSFTCES